MAHIYMNYPTCYKTWTAFIAKAVTLVLLAFAPSAAQAKTAGKIKNDTLRVEKAEMWKPVAAFTTYQTDSTDMKGEKLADDNFLTGNPLLQGEAEGFIGYGDAMPTGNNVLSQYAFRVRSSRYTKATVRVQGISRYKIYGEDGQELKGGSLTLTGDEKKLRLVVTSDKEKADTFRVDVIGQGLSINADSPRPLTWAAMQQGPHHRSVSTSPSGRYAIMNYSNLRADGKQDYWATLTDLQANRTLSRMDGECRYHWLMGQDILYYTRSRNGHRQLVTLNPANCEEKVLADNLPEGNCILSPRQDYAIYASHEKGRPTDGALRYMEEPDDQQAGWRDRKALWRIDLRSGVRQRLTFGRESMDLADISPDGQKLLLAYNRFDATRRPFSRTTLIEMDAYTGAVDTLLLDAEFLGGDAQYLPDGHTLLVNGSANAFNNIGSELAEGQIGNAFHYGLFFYDTTTRKAAYALPRGFKPSISRTTVCPGDNAAYLLTEDGYDATVYRLDLRTRAIKRVELPMTLTTAYSVATHQKHPRIIACGQDGGTLARLCFVGNEGGKFAPFGEIDAKALNAPYAPTPCHEWSFKSSRGDSIQCFYYTPDTSADKLKDLPMLVYYYGGCDATARRAETNWPFRLWAAQGYAVLVVEPSGANAFGQEFAARHVGTWGEGTAQDIIEATQRFCSEHPWVNPKKVGCLGASYGGFMTEYLQTQTDIFAAAVSHAGISNIASYWGGGYWGYTYGEVAEYGQFPWSDRDLFVEHSPLFNADKIHTPLLLIHGTADTNVPTAESQQLYTALRILGREVAYITVNGENHVVTDPVKQTEWIHTILAWFAKWLKDEPEWWEDLYPAAKK